MIALGIPLAILAGIAVLIRVDLEDRAFVPNGYRVAVMRSTLRLARWRWVCSDDAGRVLAVGFTFTRSGARLSAAQCACRHRTRFVRWSVR